MSPAVNPGSRTHSIIAHPMPEIADHLLDWYTANARRLPWRGIQNPYATWVSEIMLQQTQVDTVIPYYRRWMERFPTLGSLAAAQEQDVLAAWEGLGYYSRARNLLKAARQVMAEYTGELPGDLKNLQSLPGVGRYTAAAIASIAFGLDTPALDGNIRRVFARLYAIRIPARSPQGESLLLDLAKQNAPAGKAGDYNQALMDLGATLCTPHSPDCALCPLHNDCQAFALGIQAELPVSSPRPPAPHIVVTAGILQRAGQVLIARRPANGLLGGLWEFPGGKLQEGESLPACLQRELHEELAVEVEVGEPAGVYRHAYTHFRVTLHAFFCRLASGEPRPLASPEIRWMDPLKLENFPMGKIDRQIARRISAQKP